MFPVTKKSGQHEKCEFRSRKLPVTEKISYKKERKVMGKKDWNMHTRRYVGILAVENEFRELDVLHVL